MSRRDIEGCYARLTGMRDTLMVKLEYNLPEDFISDYKFILATLRENVEDEFAGFDLPSHAFTNHGDVMFNAARQPIESKIKQLISYLEKVHNASGKIVEVGSAYNLIKDQELKSRCSDLLSASDHFDRVINQATQVLEERLRLKFPDFSEKIGTGLVNAIIKSEPSESLLKFSDSAGEQEGYANIMRGMVGAFRNTSHHRFLESVTREQALQICAFVDNLIAAIDLAEVQDQ